MAPTGVEMRGIQELAGHFRPNLDISMYPTQRETYEFFTGSFRDRPSPRWCTVTTHNQLQLERYTYWITYYRSPADKVDEGPGDSSHDAYQRITRWILQGLR